MVSDVNGHWAAQAACRGMNDVFFPGRGESVRQAVEVCASCPVRVPCLEHALANSERYGVWGGLGERERRRVKREQAA